MSKFHWMYALFTKVIVPMVFFPDHHQSFIFQDQQHWMHAFYTKVFLPDHHQCFIIQDQLSRCRDHAYKISAQLLI